MKLGAFSLSLNVKDIKISKTFYETLEFTRFDGIIEQHYLIRENELCIIRAVSGNV